VGDAVGADGIADGEVCECCQDAIRPGEDRQMFYGLVGFDPVPLHEPMHQACRSNLVVAILQELEPHGIRFVVEHVTENRIGPLIRGWSDEPPDMSEWLDLVRASS
jgi:hypothetical protein